MQTQVMMIARSERLCTHLDKRRSHGDGRTHSAHRRAHRKASRREGSSGREEGQEELSEHNSSSFSGTVLSDDETEQRRAGWRTGSSQRSPAFH